METVFISFNQVSAGRTVLGPEKLKEITIAVLRKIAERSMVEEARERAKIVLKRVESMSPEEVMREFPKIVIDVVIKAVGRMTDSPLGMMLAEELYAMYPDNIELVDDPESPFAYTDGEKLYINPYIVKGDSIEGAAFLVMHELLHVLFAHIQRGRNKNHEVWNRATDVFINETLKEAGLTDGLVPAAGWDWNVLIRWAKSACRVPDKVIPDENARKSMTDEDIYAWIASVITRYCPREGWTSVGRYGESIDEGAMSRDVSEPLDKGRVSPNAPKPEDRLARTASAGRRYRPSTLIRRLLRVLEEYVLDWRDILRDAFSSTGRIPMETWLRPSRRLPEEWPGTKWIGEPEVVILIDFSGSIDTNVASAFLTEIERLVREYTDNVIIIAWDTQVYGEYRVRDRKLVIKGREISVPDIREAMNALSQHGGGGTEILPALKRASELVHEWTSLVVMTDGLIADKESMETREMANYLASNVARAVYVYTVDRLDEVFGPQWIKVHYPVPQEGS